MKKIVHIEDNLEWQTKVKESLKSLEGIELVQFTSYEELFNLISQEKSLPQLYILDRHICDRPDDIGPNDQSWRKALKVISHLSPGEKNTIMLSNHAPYDFGKYLCVLGAFPKQTFNPDYFRSQIKYYLEKQNGA